ncbi:MAG TPA: hypothetical protein VF598_01030 [Hymenobacter sp.]
MCNVRKWIDRTSFTLDAQRHFNQEARTQSGGEDLRRPTINVLITRLATLKITIFKPFITKNITIIKSPGQHLGTGRRQYEQPHQVITISEEFRSGLE